MPTAFVCNNDVSAYALIKALEENGYRVPEDVSVVGYDDYLYPEFGDSRITTYAVDMGEMSKIALPCLIPITRESKACMVRWMMADM